tara:strand:+ start:9655 stop:10242 length:588 start_codon:yes stop_codon:yes gene_type:complete
MKQLMTEWRLYEQQILWEQEFEEFFKEHYLMLDEGTLDWVLQKGRQVKDTVVNTIAGMKDWAGEQIEAFVQFMLKKLRNFMQGLRNKKIIGKWEHKKELAAINLLGTRKHIDLAVILLSAIAKISGGFIIDKVVKLPEIIEKIKDLLENPISALKDLLGNVKDIKTVIDKFIEYRKDRKIVDTGPMDWDDYGGLV